jgi:CheY-like chemotaxis protein
MNQDNNILLIEDSPSQATLFSCLLKSTGYRVRLASDGREGLRQAYEEQPALILLDMNLPSMNGLQVLARLRRSRCTASLPVVILSDYDNAVKVEQAIELGANDYLFKGDYLQYDAANRLHNAIEQVLHPSALA